MVKINKYEDKIYQIQKEGKNVKLEETKKATFKEFVIISLTMISSLILLNKKLKNGF